MTEITEFAPCSCTAEEEHWEKVKQETFNDEDGHFLERSVYICRSCGERFSTLIPGKAS